MIRNNLFYKLLALGVALVLWFNVNSERNPQSSKTIIVPIQQIKKSKGYVYELAKNETNVTIAGLKSVVDSVNKEDINTFVDLTGLKSTTKVKISTRLVELSNDLYVTTNPEIVKVKIEPLRWRRLPVEVKFLSAPPLGYSYNEPIITPSSVSISGKNTAVSTVKKVILAISGHSSDGSIDGIFDVTPIDGAGNAVDDVILLPGRVQVKLDFVEVPATKTVIISANVTGEPKYPAKVSRISVSPSSVTLEGKPSSLLDISTVSTDNFSIEGEENNLSKEVDLRVPPGVKVVGRSKVQVTAYLVSSPQ